MDMTKRPAFLQRYRIRPGTNDPMDKKKLIKTMAVVFFNQICIGFPMIFGGFKLYLWLYGNQFPPTRELPSITTAIVQLIGCILIYEVVFYYNHRILHIKILYKHVHKLHHEWINPTAAMSLYCHPIEYVLMNMLPHVIGPLVFKVHVVVAWAYFAFAMALGIHDHTGYHLPFFKSQEFHDYHHLK